MDVGFCQMVLVCHLLCFYDFSLACWSGGLHWFLNAESHFQTWDKFHLIMCIILIIHCWILSLIYWAFFCLSSWETLVCSFLFIVLSLSSLFTRGKNASENGLGSVLSSSIFRKSLCKSSNSSLYIWQDSSVKPSGLGDFFGGRGSFVGAN